MIEIANELVFDNINKNIDFHKEYFDFGFVEANKYPIVVLKNSSNI